MPSLDGNLPKVSLTMGARVVLVIMCFVQVFFWVYFKHSINNYASRLPATAGERSSGLTSGVPGPAGLAGKDGAKGDNGDAGLPGLIGAKGSKGSNGISGLAGAKGSNGTNGTNGTNGSVADAFITVQIVAHMSNVDGSDATFSLHQFGSVTVSDAFGLLSRSSFDAAIIDDNDNSKVGIYHFVQDSGAPHGYDMTFTSRPPIGTTIVWDTGAAVQAFRVLGAYGVYGFGGEVDVGTPLSIADNNYGTPAWQSIVDYFEQINIKFGQLNPLQMPDPSSLPDGTYTLGVSGGHWVVNPAP